MERRAFLQALVAVPVGAVAALHLPPSPLVHVRLQVHPAIDSLLAEIYADFVAEQINRRPVISELFR